MTTFTESELRQALAADAVRTPPPVDVWPQLRRRVVVRNRVRMGAALAAAAVAASVVGLALPTGHDSVRVPPASGGATATLRPDRPMSDAALATSTDVIRHRLDVLGVSGATISTHDGALVIHAPHTSAVTLNAITGRGSLQFRAVNGIAPTTSCSTSGSALACSKDGTLEYTLGGPALDNRDIASASAMEDSASNSWVVEIQFYRAGAQKFHNLTAQAAAKPDQGRCDPPTGCNAIAIVLDGIVLSAPTVIQPGGIPGGATQITGNLTRTEAQVLAALAATGPLPVAFSPAVN
jgi:preprotein translocase subunit SecD